MSRPKSSGEATFKNKVTDIFTNLFKVIFNLNLFSNHHRKSCTVGTLTKKKGVRIVSHHFATY